MTIDEAISHALEVAERYDRVEDSHADEGLKQECIQCAADHRQLAEWLTDYKELKNSIGAVRLNNMTEALKLIRAYKAENITQKKMIVKYKRLLKAAVEDFTVYGALKDLPTEQRVQNLEWRRFNRVFDILDHRWRYTDEALKLLGKDEANEHK